MKLGDIPPIVIVNQSQNVDGCGCFPGCLTLIIIILILSAISSCMGGHF